MKKLNIIDWITCFFIVFVFTENTMAQYVGQPPANSQPGQNQPQLDIGIALPKEKFTLTLFLMSVRQYSPDIFEQLKKTSFTSGNKEEITALLGVHNQLKEDFIKWDKLSYKEKRGLEESYRLLWQRLLELRNADEKIVKIYKSEMKKDGNHLPSVLLALPYFPQEKYGDLTQAIQKELMFLFDHTKNAAVISNCSNIIIHLSELNSDGQCWGNLERKCKSLKSVPLTEDTAMGILILTDAISYKSAKEAEDKQLAQGIDNRNIRQQPISILFPDRTYLCDMEKTMKETPTLPMSRDYSKEIQRMIEADKKSRKYFDGEKK